jgi:hypothetical protein
MVAVTIGIARYAKMAVYAAKAVRQNTGLETFVVGDKHFRRSGLAKPHHLKFRLFDLVGADQLMYFDADLVCLNAWDPASVADPEAIVAVRDRDSSRVRRDAELAKVRREEYFNSGMFIISRHRHLPWLRAAERHTKTIARSSFFDQTALNSTRGQMGLPIKLLNRRYNWTAFGEGPLCYQLPVFMAHRLKRGKNNVNIAYYEGTYQPPFNPQFEPDKEATSRLTGKTFSASNNEGTQERILLRPDGTIGPSPGPNGESYWFAYSTFGGLRLLFTSETHVLRTFACGAEGVWRSTDGLREVPDPIMVHEKTTL